MPIIGKKEESKKIKLDEEIETLLDELTRKLDEENLNGEQKQHIEELRKSRESIGELRHVIIEKGGRMLAGRHQHAANKDWTADIRDIPDTKTMLQIIVGSNLTQRIIPVEEKQKYVMLARKILQREGKKGTQVEIAQLIGKSQSWVSKSDPAPVVPKTGEAERKRLLGGNNLLPPKIELVEVESTPEIVPPLEPPIPEELPKPKPPIMEPKPHTFSIDVPSDLESKIREIFVWIYDEAEAKLKENMPARFWVRRSKILKRFWLAKKKTMKDIALACMEMGIEDVFYGRKVYPIILRFESLDSVPIGFKHIFKERTRKEKRKKARLERQYRRFDKQEIEELLKIEKQRQRGMENQNWDYEERKWSISIGKQKPIKDFQPKEEKLPEIKLEPANKDEKKKIKLEFEEKERDKN